MCEQSLCKVWIYKGMNAVGVTDYTNLVPLKCCRQTDGEKCLSSTLIKNEKKM